MNRRTDIEDGEAEILAGMPASPSGPPLGPTVIPFRQPHAAAKKGLVGGVEPLSTPPFQSLGSIIQSVVLRIKDDQIRLKVFRAAGEDFDGPEQ